MCATDCGACSNCRETDVWIVPADLNKRSKWAIEMDRRLERMREDPEAYVDEAREAARSHAPALTVHGFTEALGRDGGSDPYTQGGRRGW